MTASACVAALPDISLEEIMCLVLDDADPLAQVAARHIAAAVGERYEPNPGGPIQARPVPRALVLELRKELGKRLTERLEAPLPARRMRVLILIRGQRHVVDVVPQPASIRPEEEAGEAPPVRDVSGTWKDPVRYLPMPLPADWIVEEYDRFGALHVLVGGRIRLEIGAVDAESSGRVLFVFACRQDGDGKLTDAEVFGVLDRLRSVRGRFKEFSETLAAIPEREFVPGTRAFATRVLDTAGRES